MLPAWLPRSLELLGATWRYRVLDGQRAARFRSSREPAIWVLWHGHLLPLLWWHRGEGITLLVSRHRDGDYLAALAQAWGYEVVRGSSSRGGVAGLLALVRALQRGGQVAIAADGPRGPRHHAKAGAIAAARVSGAPIVPVAVGACPSWQLRSWDGFLIPAPGARVRVAYGGPLDVGEAGRAQRDAARARLQELLEQAALRAARS